MLRGREAGLEGKRHLSALMICKSSLQQGQPHLCVTGAAPQVPDLILFGYLEILNIRYLVIANSIHTTHNGRW